MQTQANRRKGRAGSATGKAAGKATGRKAGPARAASRPMRRAAERKRYALARLGALDSVQGWQALNQKLGLRAMGITVASFPPGQGYDHPHYHAEQEEVYLLAHGRGQMAIDGRIIELEAGDLVRVDPPAVRALRSHPKSPSVWVMVGATPGTYRERDYTELTDEPSGF